MAESSLSEFTMQPDSDGKVRGERSKQILYIPELACLWHEDLLLMMLRLFGYDDEE